MAGDRGTRFKRGFRNHNDLTAGPFNITGGYVVWAGSSISITHNHDNLLGLSANVMDTGTTQCPVVLFKENSVASAVSAAVYVPLVSTSATLAVSGGTVYWTAVGYND